MISTIQKSYFKRSDVFLKMMKVVFVSLRACSLPRSTCRSFRNTFSRKKVTIDGLNTISNGELHVSDPLCDNENKDLTLVILTWKKTTVYLFLQSITCTTTECVFWKRQIYSEKVFGEGFSLQKIQINKLYYGSKKYKIKKKQQQYIKNACLKLWR